MNNKDYCPHCGEHLSGFENEEWRPVIGYEGLYYVSTHGRVKSVPRAYSRTLILNPKSKSSYGYWKVRLTKNRGSSKKFIHRLVAEAFIPNPNNYPCINHKDAIKTNNHVSNLEWCTPAQNVQHAKEMGLFVGVHQKGSGHPSAKLTETQALEIKLQPKHRTHSEIAREYKLSVFTISRIRNGKTWKHLAA